MKLKDIVEKKIWSKYYVGYYSFSTISKAYELLEIGIPFKEIATKYGKQYLAKIKGFTNDFCSDPFEQIFYFQNPRKYL